MIGKEIEYIDSIDEKRKRELRVYMVLNVLKKTNKCFITNVFCVRRVVWSSFFACERFNGERSAGPRDGNEFVPRAFMVISLYEYISRLCSIFCFSF